MYSKVDLFVQLCSSFVGTMIKMLSRCALELCLLYLAVFISVSADNLGVVLLDEIVFDKVLSRFPVALVKFDSAFPYGDKHEEYSKFAREQNVLVKDLLIADVHAKDYGEKDNWSLLKRFGINEKELPTILLFNRADPSKWLRYPKEQEVTVDSLKNFVRRNTKLYIGLSGCIEEFDVIAAKFMEKFNRNEFVEMERLTEEAMNLSTQMTDDQVSKYNIIQEATTVIFTFYIHDLPRTREWPLSTCKS